MKKIIISILCIAATLIFCSASGAEDFYVCLNQAGGFNGSSWSNCWNWSTLNTAAKWANPKQAGKVGPGDTVYIDGGATPAGITYTSRLEPLASGSAGSPITIKIGQDAGHNNLVIIDTDLVVAQGFGIVLNSRDYITISGQVGTDATLRIRLTKGYYAGLGLYGTSSNFDISYLDITLNGSVENTYGVASSLAANNNWGEIHHCAIHDNYEDQFHLIQSPLAEASQYGSLKIHHNDIYDAHDDWIEISMGGVDIYNNTFHDRGVYRTGHPDGIQAYNSYYRIYNNTFYNFMRAGDINVNAAIFMDPFTVILQPSHYLIYNNLIYETITPPSGCYYRGIDIKLSEPAVLGGTDILVANNTIIGMPFTAIALYFGENTIGPVGNIVIENNLIKDCARTGSATIVMNLGNRGTKPISNITYGSHGSGAQVIVDYNLSYASSGSWNTKVAYNYLYGGQPDYAYANFKAVSGCQVHDAGSPIDPKFTSDFSLMYESPAKDAGVNLSDIFTTDKADFTRYRGYGWDIGAYEYNKPEPPRNLKIK
jgi:hypothetical protein